MRFFVMGMIKKNLSIILVILLTLLLVAMVIWIFNKRIDTIEKTRSNSTITGKGQTPLLSVITLKI
jgi:hypothetical protein